jgi:hypothetical protein
MGPIQPDETFRSQWIVHPISALFPHVDPSRPDLDIEVRCGDVPMTIRSSAGRVSVHEGPASAPDVVLTGPPDAALGLIAHRLDAREAKERGVAITGDVRLLRRLRPIGRTTAKAGSTRG